MNQKKEKMGEAKKQELIKEIKELNRNRKHYKLQSEWHRMMYALTLRLEIIDEIESCK